ncbi:MAG TPA: SgcJ/EcaC family oxidoreductase [Gemmataceae bacterium]|jgi:uncharacterized protein (TIGR02246 family)|nr:SgcJ/EcaC family oxidoreductase [Gemmataceae bacterium]
MDADERTIRDVQAAWFDASLKGDRERLKSLMTDDVVFLVPGRPPFGRDEFMAAQATGLQQHQIQGSGTFEEVIVAGEVAYCRGKLAITLTPAGGTPKQVAGYTLSVFRKLPDGRWVLARDANLLTPVGQASSK